MALATLGVDGNYKGILRFSIQDAGDHVFREIVPKHLYTLGTAPTTKQLSWRILGIYSSYI